MTRWKRFAASAVRTVPTWCSDETQYPVGAPVGFGGDIQIYALHPPDDRHMRLRKILDDFLLEDYRSLVSDGDESDPLLGVAADVAPVDPSTMMPDALEVEELTRTLALAWLDLTDDTVEWRSLFAYLDAIRYRTYENDAVTLTLVIDPKREGGEGHEITGDRHQKVFDMVATSPETFLRVDTSLRAIGYEEATAKEVPGPRFAPEFTTRTWSDAAGCFVVEKTRRGDVIITEPSSGVVACWRKGTWYVYDRVGLTRTFRGVFGPDAEGLLDLVFDLSYRRHGALLIYDPNRVIGSSRLSNPDSSVRRLRKGRDDAHAILGPSIRNIKPLDSLSKGKKVLAEMASMDGAIVFDERGVRAFGAMIVTVKGLGDVGGGARTTAMHSARRRGALPIKVSADGDITLFVPIGERDIEVQFA